MKTASKHQTKAAKLRAAAHAQFLKSSPTTRALAVFLASALIR